MAYKWQRNGKRAVKNGRDTAKSPLKTGGNGKVNPLKTGKKRAGIFPHYKKSVNRERSPRILELLESLKKTVKHRGSIEKAGAAKFCHKKIGRILAQ